MSQIPLNAAASNGDNDRQVTTSIPPEVVQCLENARFVCSTHHHQPIPLLTDYNITRQSRLIVLNPNSST